jgi:hypothetical protein
MIALFAFLSLYAADRAAKAFLFRRAVPRGALARPVWLRVAPRLNRRPWAWRGGSRARWCLAYGLALAAAGLLQALGILAGFWASLGVGALLGGALSNLRDRLALGGVRDYLELRLAPLGLKSSFNLADLGIGAGLALLVPVLLAPWVALRPHPKSLGGPQLDPPFVVGHDDPSQVLPPER